ncbi:DUF2147 domain-containing protein [Flammeovirga yaeyamensis]|uniref:DUF2147 domain-containing protein n=1 Tax=Flammeovirga yaeyamensis TaxID=367791 RepID=A0AAX1N189_9BACT|nr:DUF2147 domain-containing protein [Flammeovirga yaeyamensis]MBB3696366.1 uncharacterized protein (DUF2147 family) [Flammeovirga yaeyamensis]NMF35045.1 DUF2147 domain-containing protein [Flammeovirga yaeyamensis]QWG00131.1 DUF2147 domain-containing protein [Flammeovirga yaeyamensis]
MNKTILLLLTGLFLSICSYAQESSVFGIWKTIDDETNEAKAYVEIYKEADNTMSGKIIKLLKDPEDTTCDKCPGNKKDQKVMGMQIIWGMEKNGDQWTDGKVLKPENGKIYSCKVWVEEGKLQVRGYLGFIYKTQTWLRVE